MSSLKIVIDIRMFLHSGIGTYLQNILPYLQKSKHDIFLLGKEGDIKINAPIYSLREQFVIPLKVPACDIFWTPHFNVPILPTKAKANVVTINDVFHLAHIDQFSFFKRLYAKKVLAKAISKASRVICISEFTKSELLKFFPEFKKKFHVIYLGGGQHFLQNSTEIPAISFPFFLFVGNCKPHKNLQLLLEAFTKFLPKDTSSMHLVIAGKKEGFIHGMKFPKFLPDVEKKIHFLGKVSQGELHWLYQRASALIFPSLYEGWGFPPLEAMQFQCPVIASHAASIPEACGNAALYFNPHDAEDLCQKMLSISFLKKHLIQEGEKRIKELSWEVSAKKHLKIFEEVSFSSK